MISRPLCVFLALFLKFGGIVGFHSVSPTLRPAPPPAVALTRTRHSQPLFLSSFLYTTAPENPPKPSLLDRVDQLSQSYVKQCKKRPFLTKSLTAAAVQGVGDVLSQGLAASMGNFKFKWNILRTITFMMIGMCYQGPLLHIWYGSLARISRWTGRRQGFSDLQQSLTALALDQTIGVAIFYPLYFVAYEAFSKLVLFQAPSLMVMAAKMATDLGSVVVANYYVWPAANFLSFRYCPPALRVLYANGIAVFWNIFLCAKLAASMG